MFQYAEPRGRLNTSRRGASTRSLTCKIANEAGLYPGFRVQTVTMPAVLVHFH